MLFEASDLRHLPQTASNVIHWKVPDFTELMHKLKQDYLMWDLNYNYYSFIQEMSSLCVYQLSTCTTTIIIHTAIMRYLNSAERTLCILNIII